MATSSYASTPETTNTNRVCRVILGPCTDGLRDILRHYVPPSTFPHVIKQKKLNLPRLTTDQRDLILPRHGSYTGAYDDMDISLLYILLRNITNIPPHSNGWSNNPVHSDRSLSANIERVRLIRNECYGHSTGASMSNTEFLSSWSTIRSVMVDLDTFLNNGKKYENEVDFLRHESMDPEHDLQYEEQLRKQVEEDTRTREMVQNIEKRFEETSEKVQKLDGKVEETSEKVEMLDDKMEKLTKSVIPPNVRDQYDNEIQKWREEDKLYCETHSFLSVMKTVRDQPYVTIVGVPGSGKSATAHHIALKLQEEGYEVVPTRDVRKMEDYGDPRNPQVFVIDDVVGVFGFQETELKVLDNYEQKITKPCMVKSKTLMTCREAVFNETLPYKLFLTKEETVIKLHSSDHALDDNDKKQILQKYGLNQDLMSPALLKSISPMFPLLCKLYSKETKFQALGSKFFLNPIQCIIDELDGMKRRNKLNYATLILCMLNENSLSKDILKDRKNEHFMNMKIDSLENCKLESQTDAFKFVKALSAMEGTYTKQSGAQYTFIHDSMFEICAYHYGQKFPDQMLLYMSSSYIANYVKPQTSDPGIANEVKEKQSDSQSTKGDKSSNGSDIEKESNDKSNEREESFDLCIRLREDQYPLLAERLYRDIQNMELYDVFRNQVLKHPQVCQDFIGVLKTKPYTELKSLFLSSHGKVDKIVSKRECVLKESREWGEQERQGMLVDQREKLDDEEDWNGYTYNVRVISWVIYYGHYQILEFIIQQIEQHNETSELLEITRNSPHQSISGICTCNTQENEINRLVEQCRLLALSCYSGDVHTVRVVLSVCKETFDGIDQISRDNKWWYHTPLTAACEGGKVDIVNELVKAGADVNLRDSDGDTPLIFACELGFINVMEKLVKVNSDSIAQDYDENTPQRNVCDGGHVSVVKEFLKAGANVDLQDVRLWRNTPLIAACERGHLSVVKELVKAGVDINPKYTSILGKTPLIAACEGGYVSVVEELVKSGASVNLRINYALGHKSLTSPCVRAYVIVFEELVKEGADVNTKRPKSCSILWKTPLTAACAGGHVSVVEELVKAGADVNLQGVWGITPLISACAGGHVCVVEELIKAGAGVNLQDIDGDTPLIAACKDGHVSVVEELVKVGADVNLQNDKYTPLIAACKGGHVSVVEDLVKLGADVNLQNDWYTPLIAACEGGHVSVLEELVKVGADVNLQDNDGYTPLISACEGGHVCVVEELIKAGADVNLQVTDGDSPFIAACKEGYVRVVEVLMKVGADVNLQNDRYTPLIAACKGGHVSVVEVLVKVGADVNLQNDRYTPLIAACKGGHVSVVEVLVKVGADVNVKNDRYTPLIAACKGGHVRVVEELVKVGADVNLQNDRYTPLIAACKGGHVSVVEVLVKVGADVNVQNDRYTPLIAACKGGHVRVVEELVKVGADVNLQNDRYTPLIAACKGGHVSVVEELVKVGADVNLQNDRYTPLIAACEGGNVRVVEELVKELVKVGADVNLQDNDGYTPLISACEGGHVSVVEELIKAGADVNLQITDGDSPFIAACKEGYVRVVEVLVKVGADVNLQNDRYTPLIAACKGGHVRVVEELVKVGADVNFQNDRYTPLIAACKGGHVRVVEELVKVGADVNLQNHRYTPLIAACKGGHVSVVEELLKVGADVNLQNGRYTPLIVACKRGHVRVVEKLLKVGADVNLQNHRYTPLIAACKGGLDSVVEELVKVGADVNLQDNDGDVPLIAAVRGCSLSTVKYLVKHGTDWVTQVVDINVSAVYAALLLSKPAIVNYLIKEQNKINPGKFTGNVHLFNCLVEIRHAGVEIDSRNDVVVIDRSVWCMDRWGDLRGRISEGDCDVLRHLLCVGLDVNQSIQLYDKDNKYGVRPLLYILIDGKRYVKHRTEKVSILLGAGADVNVRVRYKEYDSVLDREGVSVLERTRRLVFKYSESKYLKDKVPENTELMCEYRDSEDSEDSDSEDRVKEYKEVMCEIKKHVRRHSV